MAKISDRFVALMKPESQGGAKVTREELEAALPRARRENIKTFAKQGIDTIADGNLVRLLAQKVGSDVIPAPMNSMAEHDASAKWLNGQLNIKKRGPGRQQKDATQLMQRALIKIGAHHERGAEVADLIQAPYGADGSIGGKTIAALNQAMILAGRADLANLTQDSIIGQDVAQALEGLVKETTVLVHPALMNQPPSADTTNVVLFMGMGDHSKHEADYLSRALPPGHKMEFIGDSPLGDDVVAVRVGGNRMQFDLKTEQGQQNFVDRAFEGPGLTQDQKELVKEAFNARAWGMADSRDEVAMMALQFHKSNISNGAKKIPFIYFSGHSAGGGVWGDHNGELAMESIKKVAEAFPKAAETVESPFFAACNHLHPRNVEELMDIFPNMEHAGGYSAYAPGTWVGGIAHCLAWINCLKEGHETITPEMMHTQLRTIQRSANGNRRNPLFFANEKRYHISSWNSSDSIYRWFEKSDGHWRAKTREMRPDPAEIQERMDAVRELLPQFEQLIGGNHPRFELRDIEPHGDNVAVDFYNCCVKLDGTMGLSDQQKAFSAKWKQKGLCARYYARILEKFGENFGQLITRGNRQMAAEGFEAKSWNALSSEDVNRTSMLGYINELGQKVAELQNAGQRLSNGEQLHKELALRVGQLSDIPSYWL